MQNIREPKETLSEKEFRFRKNSGKMSLGSDIDSKAGAMYFDIGHGRRRSRYVIGHIASWSLEAKHFNHCRTRWQQPTVVAGIREFCFLCFISFSYNSASWITLISSIINCFIAVGNHANAIKNICIKFCQRFSNHYRWQPGNFQNQGV